MTLEPRGGFPQHLPFPDTIVDVDPAMDLCCRLSPEEYAAVLEARRGRDIYHMSALCGGSAVTVRHLNSGFSLYPRVFFGDMCTFIPVRNDFDVKEEDIVFCYVQPASLYYTNKVKRKRRCNEHWQFIISSQDGQENGWCELHHIFGRLVDVKY